MTEHSLTRRISRRTILAGLAGSTALLVAACSSAPASPSPATGGAASPAAGGAASPAPGGAASPAAGAAASPAAGGAAVPAETAAPATGNLKGTALTVLAGQWYVPATNTMLDDMVKTLAQGTGMNAKVERLGQQLQPKIQAIIESGAGGDVVILQDTDPFLYGDKLSDLTDVAKDIDQAWHGWYDVSKQSCIVDGKWRALMIGQAPCAWNWRPDLFKAAGIDKFPETFDDLLAAAQKLKEAGQPPIGMTLGHAAGDGRSTNYPVLWAFGGKEFEKDGTTVALDSPETLQSVEWYTKTFKYMDPGSIAWLDPDNNQAFLAGKVSATTNVNTIYLAARDSKDPKQQEFAKNMEFANWPNGPAGRHANYNINNWAGFASSKNQAGINAFMAAFFDKKFLVPWTKTGQSYFIPTLTDIETTDAWPEDPKLKVFRELNKINRLIGWEGPPTHAVSESVAKYVIVDMYAQAVTGKKQPKDSVTWATDQYKQFLKTGQ